MFEIQHVENKTHIITDNADIMKGLGEEKVHHLVQVWFVATPSQTSTAAILVAIDNAGCAVEGWRVVKTETNPDGIRFWTLQKS